MLFNCFNYKNACFEVFFKQNCKVYFGQFLDLALVFAGTVGGLRNGETSVATRGLQEGKGGGRGGE